MTSFHRPVHALVVGTNGAIGSAMVDLLVRSDQVESVLACSRKPRTPRNRKVIQRSLDVLDPASIAAALADVERIDLAIVTTGWLHVPGGRQPEKSWRMLDQAALMESFAVNSVGPALVAKHVLPLLPRKGKAVFAALSARVGSISDNCLGGWISYRAAKAALSQFIRTLNIELSYQRSEAICVALHLVRSVARHWDVVRPRPKFSFCGWPNCMEGDY